MLDRRVKSFSEAIAGIGDGATILLGGFGGAGVPLGLCAAVIDAGLRDLVVISNNAGSADPDMSAMLTAGCIAKVICTYPKSASSRVFADLYAEGRVGLELIPQGTLVERLRCAGAGLGGFFTPVSAGTDLARGKETRIIDGREHVFETPLRGDVALIRGKQADRLGNLTYNKLARNFCPAMATAADLVVAEVDEVVEIGALDPEAIVTPGIFVDRIVLKGAPK
jgi:3-oxoadipate CoA-transferase alpha subunit